MIFTDNTEVIRWGMIRMQVMLTTYFLGMIMDVACGCLRGINHSMVPAGASFVGAFLLRVVWVLFIFPCYNTFSVLLMCYPVSWVVVSVFNCVMLYVFLKQLFRKELGQNRIALFP